MKSNTAKKRLLIISPVVLVLTALFLVTLIPQYCNMTLSFRGAFNLEPHPFVRIYEQGRPDPTPQWNLDGSQIVIVHGKKILAVNTDTTTITRITPDKPEERLDASPKIHPNGSLIVYSTSHYRDEIKVGNNYYEIGISNHDGSGQRRITTNQDNDFSPTWSPDGSSIAFIKQGSINRGFKGLHIMNEDGSRERQAVIDQQLKKELDTETTLEHSSGPVWSPDGENIAHAVHTQSTPQTLLLYSVETGGGNPRILFKHVTPNNQHSIIWSPKWSPDGQHIAFMYRDEKAMNLATLRSDGDQLTNIATFGPEGFYQYARLDWSPEGRRILVSQGPGRPREKKNLRIVETDGTGIKEIGEGWEHASWSPNGTRIAGIKGPEAKESESADPQPYLVTMNADGTGREILVTMDQDGKLRAANEKCFLWWCR